MELAYARADELLGHIVKVTPTSKVVGDLALFAVSGGIDWDELRERPQDFDLPGSVLGFLRGELGEPAGGLPQPFAARALRAQDAERSRRHDGGRGRADGADGGWPRRAARGARRCPSSSSPARRRTARRRVERYGDVSVIPTAGFFYGLRDGAGADHRPRARA